MSGGQRYWNEDTQRWEDPSSGPAPAPSPPPRPDFAPGAGRRAPWDADAGTFAGPGSGDEPAVVVTPPAHPVDPVPGPVPPVPGSSPPGGWPGTPGVPPSEPWPGAGPGPSPRSVDRRVVWSVVVGAAVVGVAVSLVLTLVVGKGDDDTDARPPATSSPRVESSSAQPTPTEEESVTPSPTFAEPPAGYVLTQDDEGFRMAVPEGWSRSETDSQYGIAVVNYRSPDRTQRLQVYQVSEATPDESFELYLSNAREKADGFEQLALENLDDGDFVGSRLEYLVASIDGEPDVGTWHIYDERFVASDGEIYAVASYGPDSDGGTDELEVLNTALGWFCPPYGICEGPQPDLS
ncbi:hypothetical protein RKD23_002960 [Streptomyces sp. SAI-170]|uniref:hypothetical protein n=1 Tax=Streptomyces sp. SAI-170 TaxID=3377729 RepID=UPI003C7E17F2